METHNLESVGRIIKKVGRYQYQKFVLICILVFVTNIYTLSYVFTASDLNYRCEIDECDESVSDSAGKQFNPEWLKYSVPHDNKRNLPSLCNRFAAMNLTIGSNRAINNNCSDENYFDRDKVLRCNRFVYQTEEHTALQEFNLHCEDNKWKLALVGTIHCVGVLINLFISGYLSDTFGRRTILIASSVGAALVGIIQAFSWNYVSFLFFKFLQTLVGAGSYSSAMILAVELVQPEHRARIATILFACASSGYLILGISAMYIHNWRTLLLVIFSPSFISIVYYWLIPESTKWLLSKNRTADVYKIVKQILKTNSIDVSRETKSLIENHPEQLFHDTKMPPVNIEKQEMGQTTSFKMIFNYPAMIVRVIACSYCWIANIFIYYGLSLISVAIGGNKYTDFMAVQFIEIPACIFVMFISERFGRKTILCSSFMISALSLLIYTFIGDIHWVRLLIYLLGKFTITVAFSILYIYTSELVPTCLRQTLLSTCSAFGRIGSIIAPQVPLLELVMKNSSMYLFTATAILAGIITLQFPETLGTELPDTIEEAIALGKAPPKRNDKL